MDVMILWNSALSLFVAIIGFFLKEKFSELQRVTILLNRTREEIAKEYVTKQEVHTDITRVLDRLDRLDEKLDRLMEARNAK